VTAVAVVVVLVGASFQCGDGARREPAGAAPTAAGEWLTYTSDRFAIEFRYPARYFVVERGPASSEPGRHAVVLMEDNQEHRDLAAGRTTVARE
jgi:hypothetical protein